MIQELEPLREKYAVKRRYLVGVSGGLDSVVLLHLLHQLGYRKLIVVHLNHVLRGRDSGADAAFVRRLAARLGYDLESHREDVRRLAKLEKQSIETAAREARYACFARVARRRRCKKIFLAHHADDQVETVLMNLFRGAGSRGLGGMRESVIREIDGVSLEILRPLLPVWRCQLSKYAEEHGLRFREDASNEDRRFLRNRIRHDLIPQLGEVFGRDVRLPVWRLAEQCQAESACLDGLVEEVAGIEEPRLSVRRLRQLPLALQRRLVHAWLRRQGVSEVDFDTVEAALALIEEGAQVAKINLPKKRHLRRRQGFLFVE